MKIVQRVIVLTLIVSTIIGVGFNLILFKPKQAKAVLGVEDTVHDIIMEIQKTMQTIKEELPIDLDTVARFIARQAMNRLRNNIIRWAQGGFRDDNQPFAITNWNDFFQHALDIGSARFIQEFGLTPLCSPIRVSLNTLLGLNLRQGGVIPYEEYAACTIGQIVDNVEEFWENPSIQVYGWDTWTALMQPQNNIFGSALMALQRQEEIQDEELNAAQQEAQAGQGYQNEAICNETDTEACKKRCSEAGPPSPDCLTNCEKYTTGICLQETIKNVGSTIHDSIEKTVSSDIDWLISTNEIDQLIEVLISSLFNKAIYGLGLTGSSGYSSSGSSATSKKQLAQEYSYQASFKQSMTSQEKYKINSDTLSQILGMIKGINGSMITCDKNQAMYMETLQNNYADILEQQAQSFYANKQGIDIKPDYEVLDPLRAPYTAYGYAWNVVPWQRYPIKCRGILKDVGLAYNSTCKDLKSGLPPFSTNSNCECIFNPDALTCPPSPYPPLEMDAQIPEKTIKQKQDFYNTCSASYIDVANKCEDCLKKAAEQCETKDNQSEQADCLKQVCNNYGNISGVKDGQDFYNKCQIEQRKSSCYSCLREYFMPSSYCGQIGEYMARAIIKYPGTIRKKETTMGMDWLNADSIAWVGRREDTCPDAATSEAKTGVDLICRIMPDYLWNGEKICLQECPFTSEFTEEELYNINDDKPTAKDCHDAEIGTGGEPGIWAIERGDFTTKGKCCATFKTHKPDDYAKCSGSDDSCGNGVVDPGEDCDGGPCCKSDCTPRLRSYATDECDSRTQDGCCDGKGYCTFDCDGGGGGGGGCTDDSDCSNGRICNDNGRCVIDRGR